jgi:hypothetical protein
MMRRRTIRTAKNKALVLAAIGSGMSMGGAAARAGISRRALFEWKAADPEFRREVDDAYELGTDRIVDHALQRALLPDHDGLLIFLLKCRDPERFNRKMLEARIVGDPNNPIAIAHQVQVQPGVRLVILPDNGRPTLTDAEIRAEREAIADADMVSVPEIEGTVIEPEAEIVPLPLHRSSGSADGN